MVLRFDQGWSAGKDINLYVKAVEVLPTWDEAVAEVERLSGLNPTAHYLAQSSHWFSEGRFTAE